MDNSEEFGIKLLNAVGKAKSNRDAEAMGKRAQELGDVCRKIDRIIEAAKIIANLCLRS
jgi:hypothetical protein